MDFSWSTDQEALYERGLAFARNELGGGPGKDGGLQRATWSKLGGFGYLGLSVPTAHGGLGLDALTTVRMVEALGKGCADTGLVFSACAHLFACVMPIVESGTETQQRELLPRLCSGDLIAANAISESGAGSDVFSLKTRASRDGRDYVLDGEKGWVTNGPTADVYLVYAVTKPGAGFLGISAFLVSRDTPGLTVGSPFKKMGLTGSPISPIYLEGCRVPESRRLGKEGQGSAVFRRSMQWERACLFGSYVGLMERTLEKCITFASQRVQGGKPIGKYQAISHRIADMKQRLEAARLLLYRACWKLDRKEDAMLEVALAKVAVSEAAIQSGLDAVQIHGGSGYVEEGGVEQLLRDAVPSTIFSGTSEIQRDIIASRLGL